MVDRVDLAAKFFARIPFVIRPIMFEPAGTLYVPLPSAAVLRYFLALWPALQGTRNPSILTWHRSRRRQPEPAKAPTSREFPVGEIPALRMFLDLHLFGRSV